MENIDAKVFALAQSAATDIRTKYKIIQSAATLCCCTRTLHQQFKIWYEDIARNSSVFITGGKIGYEAGSKVVPLLFQDRDSNVTFESCWDCARSHFFGLCQA